jgi:hypothetical protein
LAADRQFQDAGLPATAERDGHIIGHLTTLMFPSFRSRSSPVIEHCGQGPIRGEPTQRHRRQRIAVPESAQLPTKNVQGLLPGYG